MLTIFAAAGTVAGISQAHGSLRSIRLRHRAVEELAGYMDSVKARIADLKHYPRSLWGNDIYGTDVLLFHSEDNPELDVIGTIYREQIIEEYRREISPLTPSYRLRCRIEWEDYSINGEIYPRELVFTMKMMEFPL